MSDEKRIKEMLKTIKQSREEIAQLKGQEIQILNQLKAEGCETIEQATDLIAELSEKRSVYKKELDKIMEKLETDYTWE